MLGAWLEIQDQVIVAPMGGVLGVDWAGAREPLKSRGYWDEARDCIPDGLLWGLRIVSAERVRWKLCPDCTAAARRPSLCSKCGEPFSEGGKPLTAEDELRASLDDEDD